jgi:CheY-like chemotaxis protein
LPLIDADVSQLQQIIMNLAINAAEAIGAANGSVELKTSVEEVGEDGLPGNLTDMAARPGEYVVLTVEDNGCGMDEATRSRIFEPFFTTKFTGRGLGLSSVLGIVRGHKGLTTVESCPGVGTKFRVYFQVSTAGVPLKPAPDDEAPGKGTILVVDDEDLVRGVAKAALERLGYDVVTAIDGKEALGLYSGNAQRIDVVLLDMTMPVMSGEQTLTGLLEIRPDAAVVAMSGFDEREARQRFGGQILGFIQKPFTVAQLGAKIAAARRGRSAGDDARR